MMLGRSLVFFCYFSILSQYSLATPFHSFAIFSKRPYSRRWVTGVREVVEEQDGGLMREIEVGRGGRFETRGQGLLRNRWTTKPSL
jgi:hypothetical protein